MSDTSRTHRKFEVGRGVRWIRWSGLVALAGVLTFTGAGGPTGVAAAADADGSIGGLTAKFVDVKGVRTRYYDAGQGEPMVMIHGGFTGGSSTANVLSRNIPGLAKRFRVLAPDRLGSGLTGNPADHDYGTAAQVEHIYQFIQTLKLGKVHLVGHSAGGAIAFYLAVAHPEVVKTLVVVAQGPASAPASNGPTRLDLSKCPDQTQYAGLKCRVAALAYSPTTFDDEYWKADEYMAMQPKTKEARAEVSAASGEAERARTAAYKQQAWDRVRQGGVLQMPVLLYAGKDDVLDWGKSDPTAMLRGELGLFDIIAAKNPRVKMIVLNEGGHFMYREHPDEFNQDLISFIDFWARQPGGTATTPFRR